MKTRRIFIASFAVILMLLLAGCNNNNMSLKTYDKITKGMTLAEVETIMGTDTSETFVVIDESVTSLNSFRMDHTGVQLDDNGKIARFGYVPRNDPSVFIAVYSYSTKKGKKTITLKFDNKVAPEEKFLKEKLIAKEKEGF